MPSPLGHSLAALSIHWLAPGTLGRRPVGNLVALVALANLPDVDFVLGYIAGDPNRYHWQASHSLLVAVLIAAVSALIWAGAGRRRVWFAVALAAYASHLFMDLLLGPNAGPTVGLQVFWPFDNTPHMLPVQAFRMAPAIMQDEGPVRALFSAEMLPVLARELLAMLPLAAAAGLYRLWKSRSSHVTRM